CDFSDPCWRGCGGGTESHEAKEHDLVAQVDPSAAVRKSGSQTLCLFHRTGRRARRRFFPLVPSLTWISGTLRQDVTPSWKRLLVPFGQLIFGRRGKMFRRDGGLGVLEKWIG